MEVGEIERRKSRLSVSFMALAAVLVALIAVAAEMKSRTPGFVGAVGTILVLASLIAYLFFLGRLASYLGKSAVAWVALTILFSPIGILVSYFSIGSAAESAISAIKYPDFHKGR